jgi:hypothetical protein
MPGAKKFGAYNNRILRVNLTDGKFSEETLSDELVHDYIGGRGFGAKLLYDELRPGIDPLGEENELICLVGPMTGTNSQSFHRWKVTFKSPLTGGYFTSSAGGFFRCRAEGRRIRHHHHQRGLGKAGISLGPRWKVRVTGCNLSMGAGL